MSYSKLKSGEAIPFHTDLTIQLVQRSDLEDIFAMFDDERVNKYLFFAPSDISVYQAFFDPIVANTEEAVQKGVWPDSPTFVIRSLEGKYMGMSAVTQVMFHDGNHEVGYQLPVKAWGQGIATAACKLMIAIGFDELKSHKVSADCYQSNIGSYKTLERCGFVQEGCQKDYFKTEIGFDDKLYYGMTKPQYQALYFN